MAIFYLSEKIEKCSYIFETCGNIVSKALFCLAHYSCLIFNYLLRKIISVIYRFCKSKFTSLNTYIWLCSQLALSVTAAAILNSKLETSGWNFQGWNALKYFWFMCLPFTCVYVHVSASRWWGRIGHILPCTCRVPEASAFPTLFSDTQVYVPSSSPRTWVRRRLLSLRISNLERHQHTHYLAQNGSLFWNFSCWQISCFIANSKVIWFIKPLKNGTVELSGKKQACFLTIRKMDLMQIDCCLHINRCEEKTDFLKGKLTLI